ncbi:hypothetical protein [Niveispirillum sp.]|uniref:hypothetical protein n=1 Tax=Niveispirillum sp. TaxID=1917217 RepID=UPI001B55C8E7|nr:hypothetical protein [Niveispirillum sp.]MBP7339637.1 hypothetical protein [Niveispirillum sp.]
MGASGQAANARLGQAANDSSGALRQVGPIAQQAGFQVQDFFVQVASGQNALVAFAQQAPQFLGAFGVFGSLAGAALAIGAVGAQLIFAGDEAEEAGNKAGEFDKIMAALNGTLDNNETSIEDLIESYEKLSETMKSMTELRLQGLSTSAREEMRKLSKEMLGQVEELANSQAPGWLESLFNPLGSAFQNQTTSDRIKRLFEMGRVQEAIVLLSKGDEASRKLAVTLSKTAQEYTELQEAASRADAQIALYQGRATAQQKALLDEKDGQDELRDARDKNSAALARLKNLVQDNWDIVTRHNEGLSQQKRILEGLRGPMDEYAAKVKEIDALAARGILAPVDAATARAQASVAMMQGVLAQADAALANTDLSRAKADHQARMKRVDVLLAEGDRLLGPEAKKRGEEAKRVLESIRTPMEVYAAEVARLNTLLEKGYLSQDEYNAAVARADQDLERAVAKTDAYAAGITALQQTLISSFSGVGDGIAKSLLKGESALTSFGNLALNVVDRIIGAFIQMAMVNPLLNSLFSLSGSAAMPVLGFASGGWTGGQRNKVAGAVHGEEFVVKAPYAAQARGALEALNRGQGLPSMAVAVPQVPVISMPSMASGPVTVNIHGAPAGSNPQVNQRSTAGGGREIDVYLEGKMRDAMPRMMGDGSLDGTMGANFGVRRPPTRRG